MVKQQILGLNLSQAFSSLSGSQEQISETQNIQFRPEIKIEVASTPVAGLPKQHKSEKQQTEGQKPMFNLLKRNKNGIKGSSAE